MSISLHSLKKGMFVEIDGEPCQVLEANFLRMQQRKPVVQTKIKNLMTGKITEKSFKPSDKIEEVEIEKAATEFFYQTKNEVYFRKNGDKIGIPKQALAEKLLYLKKDVPVTLVKFQEKIISIELPPKVDLEVASAPEAIRGDTAQGSATKIVKTETGLEVKTPLFIKEGDIIRINTETGEYAERVN